jgi:hypothetical protein
MRNEGPFIVEWVAWYRRLGFSDIVVVTNNCTDRSADLLDGPRLAGSGVLGLAVADSLFLAGLRGVDGSVAAVADTAYAPTVL